jgi:hypothetical protein
VTDVMHSRAGYCLWWFLYRIDCIRRFVPTPPERHDGRRSPAGYMTRAMWEWKRACHEHNLRFLGPIRESQSVGDWRWPFNEHDARTHQEGERQRAHLRAQGYTFPVVSGPMSEDDWRAWGERERQKADTWVWS